MSSLPLDLARWDAALAREVTERVTGEPIPDATEVRVLAVGLVAQVRWSEAGLRANTSRRAESDIDEVLAVQGLGWRKADAADSVGYALEKLQWSEEPVPASALRASGLTPDDATASGRVGVRWRAMTLVRVQLRRGPFGIGEELLLCVEPRWVAARRKDPLRRGLEATFGTAIIVVGGMAEMCGGGARSFRGGRRGEGVLDAILGKTAADVLTYGLTLMAIVVLATVVIRNVRHRRSARLGAG
jgi:hypothetical protein